MRAITLLLALSLSASNAFSADLKLNYSMFFGYMKTLYKLDYAHVTTAFYLVDKNTKQPCEIKNAEIVVDTKREQIDFDKNGQLRPFYSDEHRKDGAMIEVTLLNPNVNHQCDLNVTLMAKESELDTLSYPKMKVISMELEGVLRKNAGMIAKYFLPTFEGVRLQPEIALSMYETRLLDKQIKISITGDLLISNEFLNEITEDKPFPIKIKRITPWINVGK